MVQSSTSFLLSSFWLRVLSHAKLFSYLSSPSLVNEETVAGQEEVEETVALMPSSESKSHEELPPMLKFEEVAEAVHVPSFEGTLDGNAHWGKVLVEEE